jgi:hypothetical protein
MNSAGRGVVLAIAAVVLGAVILGQGFDDPTAGGVETDQPTATPTPDSGGDDSSTDDGTTDGTTDGATDGSTDGTSDGTTDGTTDGSTDGTTDDAGGAVLHPASQIRLVVANGTDYQGLAKLVSDQLVAANGYVGLDPKNSTNGQTVALTTVYYADGYQLDASRIAEALGKERILPMPSPAPVDDLQDANILVELGADSIPG